MREEGAWRHERFTIRIVDRHPDGAYRTIDFELSGVPGVRGVRGDRIASLTREHRFRFVVPREYPHDLDLQIRALTALFHPRISGETGKACYQVHGEIDRVLNDLLYNVLLRPDVVRPPNLYRGADWGLEKRKMEWYMDAGPERVHAHLLDAWRREMRGGAPAEDPDDEGDDLHAVRFLG